MFGAHLLTPQIQFGVCDELGARRVAAAADEGGIKQEGRKR